MYIHNYLHFCNNKNALVKPGSGRHVGLIIHGPGSQFWGYFHPNQQLGKNLGLLWNYVPRMSVGIQNSNVILTDIHFLKHSYITYVLTFLLDLQPPYFCINQWYFSWNPSQITCPQPTSATVKLYWTLVFLGGIGRLKSRANCQAIHLCHEVLLEWNLLNCTSSTWFPESAIIVYETDFLSLKQSPYCWIGNCFYFNIWQSLLQWPMMLMSPWHVCMISLMDANGWDPASYGISKPCTVYDGSSWPINCFTRFRSAPNISDT